jgi:hypothetical protein
MVRFFSFFLLICYCLFIQNSFSLHEFEQSYNSSSKLVDRSDLDGDGVIETEDESDRAEDSSLPKKNNSTEHLKEMLSVTYAILKNLKEIIFSIYSQNKYSHIYTNELLQPPI